MKILSRMLLVLAIGASITATVAWAQDKTPPTPTPVAEPGTAVPSSSATILPPTPSTGPTAPIGPAKAKASSAEKDKALPPDLSAPLSIDDALETAFHYNPDVRIALDVVQRSSAVVKEAEAGFNPKVTSQITYTKQPQLSVEFGQPPENIIMQQGNSATAVGNVLLPLDINKKITFTTNIAKYQFQIQYLNLVGVSQRLIFNVKSAYYSLLRACGQEQVAVAAVQDAEVQLKDARSKFAAGVAAKFDVDRAEVNVANLNQQLIAARKTVETSRSTFNRVLGIDVNSMTTVQGIKVVIEAPCTDVPKSVQVAYGNRPEVKIARTSITLNSTSVKLARTGYLPSMNIQGNGTYNAVPSPFQPSSTNWSATVNVSIPIWDGGVTHAKVLEAQADVLNSENTLDQTKQGVALEVRMSALNLLEASERIKTTAQNVTLAEEALRLSNVRYSAGISPLVEVTDAQNALTLARFNYVNAEYDYATALADYQRATSTQPETQKLQILDSRLVCFG